MPHDLDPTAREHAPERVRDVLPAAIGNIIGAFFLVALPFYIASGRRESRHPSVSTVGVADMER